MRTSCCGVMTTGQCTDCPLTAPLRPLFNTGTPGYWEATKWCEHDQLRCDCKTCENEQLKRELSECRDERDKLKAFYDAICKLTDNGPFGLTDSPKSFLGNVRELVSQMKEGKP